MGEVEERVKRQNTRKKYFSEKLSFCEKFKIHF